MMTLMELYKDHDRIKTAICLICHLSVLAHCLFKVAVSQVHTFIRERRTPCTVRSFGQTGCDTHEEGLT